MTLSIWRPPSEFVRSCSTELAETSEERAFGMPGEAGREMLRDSLSAYIEEKMEYVVCFYIIEEHNGCIAVPSEFVRSCSTSCLAFSSLFCRSCS